MIDIIPAISIQYFYITISSFHSDSYEITFLWSRSFYLVAILSLEDNI